MKEILAPAGDKQTAIVAINHGADAVYLGYSAFSARASATNFTMQELAETVDYAHFFGAKIYVAMNTLVKNNELDEFVSTLLKLYALKVDAFILQDIFLGKYIHEHYPDVCLHLSTQAGVNNVGGASLAKSFGFSRIILARETPLAEIEAIAKIIETEVFVQGALCTSYSGQCYLSGFVGDNSGNRGRCKQPCRKKYTHLDAPKEYSGYPLSLADLCVGESIEYLIKAGVSSFKIEGRMRRSEYVASAVRYYRDLLDGLDPRADFKALKRNFNRGNYTKGLAFGQDKTFISNKIQGHIGEKIGKIFAKKGQLFIQTKEVGKQGDAYKILRDGYEVGGAKMLENRREGILISADSPLKDGDDAYITTDTAYADLISKKRTRRVCLTLSFVEGKLPQATYFDTKITGDFQILTAQKNPLSETEIRANFQKTDVYPYEIDAQIFVQGNCFLPKSELNAFRRKVFESIWAIETQKEVTPYSFESVSIPTTNGNDGALSVMGSIFTFKNTVDLLIFKPFDYNSKAEFSEFFAFAKNHARKTALYVPGFLTTADKKILSEVAPNFDLIYGEGLESYALSVDLSIPFLPGTGFNLVNGVQCAFFPESRIISKEIDSREQRALSGSVLGVGSLKVMDLLYCPFHHRCDRCDDKNFHRIKDEDGRIFLIRRYKLSTCRFELYNCAYLVNEGSSGVLLDFSTIQNQQAVLDSLDDLKALKEILVPYTSGHKNHSVL